ncbi:Piso0_004937 [Millerozyma farinosa CBS 7064]|uniref:Piso0_004937 protein n=1 Tax=Pichia sorbitophila (strain ATCC MYA-4447 / BCRC 22081 / CBS 7064 / NBRC 10061 / NRRL Y-12695) TaxID=559304 RepID=G8Y0U4_PICSO|nr:Piso0_004937 [Millerozyma farinosa CBS 7064]
MTVKVEKPTNKREESIPPQKSYPLRETIAGPEPEPFYNNYQYDVPIALDFGTSSLKVGLTNTTAPNNVFPALVARYRDRRAQKTLTFIGNDIFRDPALRSSSKGPYDGALVTNWDYIEYLFDYSFEHLGVHSDNGRINNPIIMTEPVACPLAQRKNMYELLFEAYQAPKVALGIDSLFSFYANSDGRSSGLVVGTGNESTHMIPVLNGKGILSQTKRIDFGGNSSSQFISKLLSLKYPYFPTKLTPQHTTNIFKDHCYVSMDYQEELAHYLDIDRLEDNDIVLQAPVDVNLAADKRKSEEELAKQAQKKREQGKRLQEQAQQKRLEKLLQKEQELQYYNNLKSELEELPPNEAQRRLEAEEFEDMNDFKKYVTNLEKSIKRSKNQDMGNEEVDEVDQWPLINIPDDQLSPEEIKEKRKQKLLKANYDARIRAKEAKKQEAELLAKQSKEEEEWRERDLEGWCNAKKDELNNLVKRVKERAKLINSFKDRKSAATQQRMKNIADLANDASGSTSAASRKRRRNANATIDNDPNDTFGANDDDWGIYRDISNAAVEEEQEEDYAKIVAIEEKLIKYDPEFTEDDTLAASQALDWKSSALHKFLHGPRQNVAVALGAKITDPEELANHPEIIKKNHQIHFNIERIRVPEILFQPSMAGLDQAGISEIAEDLVYRRLDGNFSPGGQSHSMINDVFLTGGLTHLKNLRERVVKDFTEFLPSGAPLKVRQANDPILDAWKGMQKWAGTPEAESSYVTKEEYEEMGAEYIKEHNLGNVCLM